MQDFEQQIKKLCAQLRKNKDHTRSLKQTWSQRNQIKALTSARSNSSSNTSVWFGNFLKRPLIVSVSALILVLLLGTSSAFAAQNTYPGDALYPVKRAGEKMVLMITSSPEAKVTLHIKYADRRINELEHLYRKEHITNQWHDQIAQDINHEMDIVVYSIQHTEPSQEFADIVLQFEELAREHQIRMLNLAQQLNTTTVTVINSQEKHGGQYHDQAIQALKDAERMFDDIDQRHQQLQKRINERLQFIEETNPSFDDPLKRVFDRVTSTDDVATSSTIYFESIKHGNEKPRIRFEINGEPVEVNTTTNTTTIDTPEMIQLNDASGNATYIFSNNIDGFISNTSIYATGTNINIHESSSINTKINKTIQINGETIEYN